MIKILGCFYILLLVGCVNQEQVKLEQRQQFDQRLAKYYCFDQRPGSITQPSQYYLEDCYRAVNFPPVLLDIQNKNSCGEVTHQKFLIQTVQVKSY